MARQGRPGRDGQAGTAGRGRSGRDGRAGTAGQGRPGRDGRARTAGATRRRPKIRSASWRWPRALDGPGDRRGRPTSAPARSAHRHTPG
ncbi:MAG TPA: hypothetical protein ENK18_28400 [Deltaproteobacteria bacterium]|nr:hypothetical protein [Deltaproteobacteria bacterium]